MLSISKPLSANSAEKYYDRDEYYLDSKGEWGGSLSDNLGLKGEINKEDFSCHLRGFNKDGDKLVASAGSVNEKGDSRHRSGIDMTFSASKSVSILSYHDVRIEEAFNKALENTLNHAESNFTRTRRKDKSGKIHVINSNKLLYAKFLHRTSRELDPQLHAHCVLFNMTEDKNGDTRALLNDEFYKNKMYLGQHFRSELAKEIKDIGYKINITDRKQGFWEIDGVDKNVLNAFSKRSDQVVGEVKKLRNLKYSDLEPDKLDDFAKKNTFKSKYLSNYKDILLAEKDRLLKSNAYVYKNFSDAQLHEMAVLDTRAMKKSVTKEKIVDQINETCSEFSTSLEDIANTAKNISKKDHPTISLTETVQKALDDVTEMQSGFDKFSLYKQALKLGLGEYTSTQIIAEFRHFMAKGDILHLGDIPSFSGEKSIYSSKSMVDTELNVMKLCKEGVGKSTINLSLDETNTFIDKTDISLKVNVALNIPRNINDISLDESYDKFHKSIDSMTNEYLKEALIELRKEIINHKTNPNNTTEPDLDSFLQNHENSKEYFEKNGYGFTPGQKEAIVQIASSKCQFSVIQGDAGTGKSFSMLYAKNMLENKGFTVRGLAPTGKASNELKESAKIDDCNTIDSFLLQFENADDIKKKNMFDKNKECWVVDESGMAGSKKVLRLMEAANYAGAKVVFVGDRKQFASIEAGKMFSELQDKAGIDTTIMPDVMRQKTKQTKSIVKAISLKDMDFAFNVMEGRDEVTFENYNVDRFNSNHMLQFNETVGDIEEGSNVKVKSITDSNTLILEVFDEETRLPKDVEFNPLKHPNSFKVFESEYDNVIETYEDREQRLTAIAKDYLDNTGKGVETMVITGTNKDRNVLNELIRDELVTNGTISNSHSFSVFESNSIGGEASSFADSYLPGQIIFANNNIKGMPRGTQGEIISSNMDDNSINVKFWDKNKGRYSFVDINVPKNSNKFNSYNVNNKDFGVGDKIVFLKNDKKLGVQNGQLAEILSLDQDGEVKASIGGKIIEFNIANNGPTAYNYVDHAFALSEYKSQGATVDRLVWHAPTDTGSLSSNSFYVAITRCTDEVAVYTNDVEELKAKVKNEQEKISTLDFIKPKENKKSGSKILQRKTIPFIENIKKISLIEIDPLSFIKDFNKSDKSISIGGKGVEADDISKNKSGIDI